MSSGDRCRDCGAPILAGSPGGLCGRCLFAVALESPNGVHSPQSIARSPEDQVQSSESAAERSGAALSLTEKVGDRIGRYKLLRQIGEGGFGVVYKAQQLEPVNRLVALKIIKLGMDTRQVVARFEAERQALALMDHPNIAKVLDGGATDVGRPYFVMELVHGIRVTDYCDQNQISIPQRLELFVQICRAIQHAHQKGIIHRDIKPSNILVTVHDGVPVPKIIDFGIAKATQAELTEQTVFTEFGCFIGTPAYMSPEQAESSGLDIDTRSDIYSLGVLLYELLTGATPFDTKQLLAGGFEHMRQTIREKEPLRPSTRLGSVPAGDLTVAAMHRACEPRRFLGILRGDLDWIVMKCLEKDRARRYETVNGLARDIERYLNSEPVVARPPSRLYEFQKTVRRHKLGFAAAAAIVTLLGLGTVISTGEALRARRAERAQERSRVDAEQARRDATEKLWGSYLAEARARRRSGEAGQRFESLAALSNAAAIRPSLELRNEAIAAMALADIRAIPGMRRRFKHNQEFGNTDAPLVRYAVGDTNGTVSIRRLSDDHELLRLPAAGGGVRPWVSFVPNGDLLAAVYADKCVRFWDLSSGKVVWELPYCGFAFSRDFQLLATIESNNIALYDPSSRERLMTMAPDGSASGGGAFDPSGRLLAYIADDTNVVVLDMARVREPRKLVHPLSVLGLTWYPRQGSLVTACGDNLIHVWDAETGKKVRTLAGHKGNPVSLDFTRNGRILASSGWDGRIRLWDFENGRQLVSILETGEISFAPQDGRLVARSWDLSGLDFFEVVDGQEARAIYERGWVPGAPGGSAFFSASGRLLVYDTPEGAVVYDLAAQREVGSLAEHVWVTGFGPGDREILGVIWNDKGESRAFRWSFDPTNVSERIAEPVLELGDRTLGGRSCLSANRKVFAVVGEGRAQVFGADALAEQARTGVQQGMNWAAVSPDGSLVATGPFHGYGVKIWDVLTGNLVKDLPLEPEGAAVAFTPDGQRLVTGVVAPEGVVYQFWSLGNWSAGLRILQQGDTSFVPMMAFSPDGRILAGTTGFTKVRLYDAASGETLADLEPPDPWQVTCLCFSPDGTQLAVCEGHSALHLWDLLSIRQQLARMHLDWDLPEYAPKAGSSKEPSLAHTKGTTSPKE